MTANSTWAVGVDVGGTKIEAAQVDSHGYVHHRVRRHTQVFGGPAAVMAEIEAVIKEVRSTVNTAPIGVGVGIAGQIQPITGIVQLSPNLSWHEVPLQSELSKTLNLPVLVTNDVQAATCGELLYGAGKGHSDIVCVFIGTGIGGGVISHGKLITGASGTAGEIGHMTIALNGRPCHCRNYGCLETIAGGWAIALRSQELVTKDLAFGSYVLSKASGSVANITAKLIVEAALNQDLLAVEIMNEVKQALVAGMTNVVNIFNPNRLILGGGIIEGMPDLIKHIELGVEARALKTAVGQLTVTAAELHDDSGVIGAAALALHSLKN